MFTGIVTGLGRVASLEKAARGGARLTVAPPARFGRFAAGESVAVSGVCLTALEPGRLLLADLSAETLRCSTLGHLSAGDPVNLERSLAWGDRLSGHFVMGHVDGVARLTEIARAGTSLTFRFSAPARLMKFVAVKGSVALDGVSLTVAARRRAVFHVAVIPETLRRTTLGRVGPGARLNFEADVFARYGARGWRRAVRPPRLRR
jgi:riboflavin synthase alpha subunit